MRIIMARIIRAKQVETRGRTWAALAGLWAMLFWSLAAPLLHPLLHEGGACAGPHRLGVCASPGGHAGPAPALAAPAPKLGPHHPCPLCAVLAVSPLGQDQAPAFRDGRQLWPVRVAPESWPRVSRQTRSQGAPRSPPGPMAAAG